jgi:hypothetical protein
MAVSKSIILKTETEVVVKFYGTDGSTSVNLTTDLLTTTQALDGDVQTVNIIGVLFVGGNAAKTEVVRNGVVVLTCNNSTSSFLDFSGQDMPPENTENISDISVSMVGADNAQVWIKLRKVSGYKSLVEDWKYGSYDDPTRSGASTTLSGSPDKV